MVWRWRLSADPVTPAERTLLTPDLAALGADASLIDVYEATVRTRTRRTRADWLRAEENGELVGLTLIVSCRDSGVSFFGTHSRLNRALHFGPWLWYWERTNLGADGVSCPGLVAPGIERATFATQATAWLTHRRLLGSLIDDGSDPVPASASGAFVGSCLVRLDPAVAPTRPLLDKHRNLRRKIRRFTGRGGRIERSTGPLPVHIRPQMLQFYAFERPINPPFVDFYHDLLDEQWSLPGPRLHHLLARIDDSIVGYHTFWHSGSLLVMLSGAVGRPATGSVHAYENLMVASLELAHELGCQRADFGLSVNAAKRAMLGSSANHLHLICRFPPVRTGLGILRAHSRLGPAAVHKVLDRNPAPA